MRATTGGLDLRVLDLADVSGVFCTRLLVGLGAEVIRIEPPGGDPLRARDPLAFAHWNAGKRSVTLDLEAPGDAARFRRLIAASDVVVENFSARVMASWGLDFAAQSAIRPGIILVSMAGMGQTGPWRDHVTYADAVQALAGVAAEAGLPGGEPLGLTFGLGDMVAGCHAALATLAALEYRDATGHGQHVDLSQVEAVASQMGTALLEVGRSGASPRPRGNRHVAMAPHGVFPCRGEDRWCAIAVGSDPEWRALCGVLGHSPAAEDPRFASGPARMAHEDALEALIADWTRGQDGPALVERLQAAGVPAGMVQDGRDLLDDPQLRARGFYVTLTHPRAGAFPHEGVVARLSETPGGVRAPAPCLGEHTDEVLGSLLGLDAVAIERYREAGVLE